MGETPADGARGLLCHPEVFIKHVTGVLHESIDIASIYPRGISAALSTSSVLLPMGPVCKDMRSLGEPCIIFNKRSRKVKQPGDLCFPGGRVARRVDPLLSRLTGLPFFPLSRHAYWRQWKLKRPDGARRLAILLTTCLRESFEEMRLNPLGVRFLGPLPAQRLVMFHRVIYPMVGWVRRQKHFFPNWEVEKIVQIPLQNLLNPDDYVCYRVHMNIADAAGRMPPVRDFPCFVHRHEQERELLWGATYRITAAFLELIFGFEPPEMASLPVVEGFLDRSYLNGAP